MRKLLIVCFFCTLAIAGCKPSPPRSYSTGATGNSALRPFAINAPSRPRRGRADTQGTPGIFDFYLLNLSWSPEFCATHSNSAECGHGLGFVIHGLWPQYNTGDYPQDCSNAPGPADPQTYTDLIPTVSLVEHEWQTHGTCSGLSAEAYFNQIRQAVAQLRIPSDIGTTSSPASLTPSQFLQDFSANNPGYPADSFALSCGNNRLTAVEVCLAKDLKPESCNAVRSCRANVIGVTPK